MSLDLPPPSKLLPPLRGGGTQVRVAVVPHPTGGWRVVQVFAGERDDEASPKSSALHDQLLSARAVATTDEGRVLLTDWTPSATLAELLQACAACDRPLPPHVAVRVFLDVCEAAAALHAAGAPHGAICPRSIHVGLDGTSRLLERRLALATPPGGMTRAMRRRHLAYAAPEVLASGAGSRRADVFSMGVVGWELLAGRRLFAGQGDHDTTRRVVAEEAPRISHAAPLCQSWLDNAIAKALAKRPGDRYADLGELWIAVDRIAARNDWIGTAEEVAAHVERVLGEEIQAREQLVADLGRSVARAVAEASPAPPAEELALEADDRPSLEINDGTITCELPARPSAPPPSARLAIAGRLSFLALTPVAAVVALAFATGRIGGDAEPGALVASIEARPREITMVAPAARPAAAQTAAPAPRPSARPTSVTSAAELPSSKPSAAPRPANPAPAGTTTPSPPRAARPAAPRPKPAAAVPANPY